jgi:hypothetical protein
VVVGSAGGVVGSAAGVVGSAAGSAPTFATVAVGELMAPATVVVVADPGAGRGWQRLLSDLLRMTGSLEALSPRGAGIGSAMRAAMARWWWDLRIWGVARAVAERAREKRMRSLEKDIMLSEGEKRASTL